LVALRLLLVDDYPPLRLLLRELLCPRGFEVAGEAGDGADAVQLLDHLACDVVIMDLNMPTMGGVEATTRIRAQHPRIHIVGFSSTDDPSAVEHLLQAGANAHFSKLDYDGLIDHLYGVRAARPQAG
jgi:DNA-binding NarL/FixJ family response regulator